MSQPELPIEFYTSVITPVSFILLNVMETLIW